MPMKKLLLFLLLSLVSIIVVGCMEMHSELTINKDRSADYTHIILVDPDVIPYLDENFLAETKNDYQEHGYQVSDYQEHDMIGFKASMHLNDIDNETIILTDENEKPQNYDLIVVKKGFLKNSYHIRSIYDYSDMKDLKDDPYVDMIFDAISFTFTLNLPTKAKNANTGNITNNGQTLEWDLFPGERNVVEADFELINTSNIILSILLALIIIAVIVILYMKKKTVK